MSRLLRIITECSAMSVPVGLSLSSIFKSRGCSVLPRWPVPWWEWAAVSQEQELGNEGPVSVARCVQQRKKTEQNSLNDSHFVAVVFKGHEIWKWEKPLFLIGRFLYQETGDDRQAGSRSRAKDCREPCKPATLRSVMLGGEVGRASLGVLATWACSSPMASLGPNCRVISLVCYGRDGLGCDDMGWPGKCQFPLWDSPRGGSP